MSALLAVESLTLEYPAQTGMVRVLDDVSFTISPGETLGLAGESGSGKSQIALALMGLLPARAMLSGQIQFEGQRLTALPASARRTLYGRRDRKSTRLNSSHNSESRMPSSA
jgi:ABC-type glutathione transport system ATPase component